MMSGTTTPVERRSMESSPLTSLKARRNTFEHEGNDEPAPLPVSTFMQKQAKAMAERRQSNAAAAFMAVAALQQKDNSSITDEEGEITAGPGYYTTNKVLTVTNRTFQSFHENGLFAKGTEVNNVVRTTGALTTHVRDTVCSKKAFPGGFATVLARKERYGRDAVGNSSPLKKGIQLITTYPPSLSYNDYLRYLSKQPVLYRGYFVPPTYPPSQYITTIPSLVIANLTIIININNIITITAFFLFIFIILSFLSSEKLALTKLDNDVDKKPHLYFRPSDIKKFRTLIKQQEGEIDNTATSFMSWSKGTKSPKHGSSTQHHGVGMMSFTEVMFAVVNTFLCQFLLVELPPELTHI